MQSPERIATDFRSTLEADQIDTAIEGESDYETAGGYTGAEIRRNRRNIVLWTMGILVFFWCTIPPVGAIAVTLVVLPAGLLCLKLFASDSSIKLDENSPGTGKSVPPRLMGGIVGYFFMGD